MTPAERKLLLAVAKRLPTKLLEVYGIDDLIIAVEAEEPNQPKPCQRCRGKGKLEFKDAIGWGYDRCQDCCGTGKKEKV